MGRKKARADEAEQEKPRERQIWITGRRAFRVCDSLAEAALYISTEARIPVSAWQVEAALRIGFPFCGMTVSYTKPEFKHGKRPPLLRRNQLEEGTVKAH